MIRISENEHATVRSILKKHIPNCEVRAFGSRYKQTSKEHSDLDLAVVGDQKIPASIIDDLREDFQNSDLPWRVDV
ncbi:MAG: nucleotidyltransferase domain-containing protein, partial [Synergistaceae bacterium]|nr:nucleotidyltransferase domain-containing protein [Synergistaceae bacterium]